MDKNKLIGVVLISVLLMVYSHFFSTKPSNTVTVSSNDVPSISVEESFIPLQTSATNNLQIGDFSEHIQGIVKEVVLENENIQVTLTSRGAKIKEVRLKKYYDQVNQPLTLLNEESSDMTFQFSSNQTNLLTNILFFQVEDNVQNTPEKDTKTVAFRLSLGPDKYIRQIFSLPNKGYAVTQAWEFVGMESYIDKGKINFVWNDLIRRAEKDVKACRNKTNINYYLADQSFHHLKENSVVKEEKNVQSPIKWLAIKQRFFTAAILSEHPFEESYILLKPTTQPDKIVKEAQIKLKLAGDSQAAKKGVFKFYFGPNKYQDLNEFAPGFSKNLPLGWPVVKWINQFLIIPIFSFIEKYVNNYGIVILLLVLFIKILLLPLSYKSYISMAEMKVLKPTLDKLKERHGKDLQRVQMEQVKLYKEMGINPLSGCIPVLLQMPILLAMFNFFPNAIELRQKAFLWAPDLSTYDAIINLPFTVPFYGNHISLFTLLMTASTILYTWSSNQVNAPQGPMKTMSYIFPITFMFILNSFPAGLSFYYFISNLITFAQQMLIKRFVNEEKIKEKLAKNKEKSIDKEVPFKKRFKDAIKIAASNKEKNN